MSPLSRLPETEPLASFLDGRSTAVKDLRHGMAATDEARGGSVDDYRAHRDDRVPFLAGASYCFVGATVTEDRNHPMGRLVGDLLVTFPSAAGSDRHRSIPFDVPVGAHVGASNHFRLLNHPTVYEHLREWLSQDRASDPPA